MNTCSVTECGRVARQRGMCGMHYQRWRKHGDALFIPIRSYRRPVKDRLLSRAVRVLAKGGQEIGCLEWRGSCRSGTNGDYGLMQVDGKAALVHRVAYTLANGEIPEGLLICHSCDNTICIEETHLFAGTPTDNMRDMISKGRAQWQKRRAHGDVRI